MDHPNFDYDKTAYKNHPIDSDVLSRQSFASGNFPLDKPKSDEPKSSGINGSDILFPWQFEKSDLGGKPSIISQKPGDYTELRDARKGAALGSKDFPATGFRTGGSLDDVIAEMDANDLYGKKSDGTKMPLEARESANLSLSLFEDAYKNQMAQRNEPRKKIGSFQVSAADPKTAGDSVEVPNHPEIAGASIQARPMKDGSMGMDVHWIDRNKLTSLRIPLSDFQKRYPEARFFRDKYEE